MPIIWTLCISLSFHACESGHDSRQLFMRVKKARRSAGPFLSIVTMDLLGHMFGEMEFITMRFDLFKPAMDGRWI